MPIVNGHPVECGCYVEGHWGQYGPDHLADQAEGFGWVPTDPNVDDPRAIRESIDKNETLLSDDVDRWMWHDEAADDIETWLNDRTDDGYVWHWHDGEFFLSPLCENRDCTDETCAHWEG